MPESYLKKTKNLIAKIIAAGDGSPSPLLKEFISQFYLHASASFLAEQKPADLYAMAKSTWSFASSRGEDVAAKVRVFNPSLKRDGWRAERTIIELNVADSPFIFDSVTAELTGKGLQIYEVMHPVIEIERKKGKPVKIHENGNGNKLESIMHFQVSHVSDRANLKTLREGIMSALHFVSLAVADWPKIMKKVAEIEKTLDYKTLPLNKEYVTEVKDFLKWAAENNYIFLGYCEYDFSRGSKPKAVQKSQLGIFRAAPHRAKPAGHSALPNKSVEYLLNPKTLVEITKSTRKSIVHRPVHMDYIGVKKFNEKGEVIGEHLMLGLFTSLVYYQSAKLIPIIRNKMKSVIERSGFPPSSHNGKALAAALEGFPRDELLQISEADLFKTCMGIVELQEKPNTKLFVRKDAFSRFVSCLIFVPRDRYNTQLRQKVQIILENAFKGRVTDYYTQVTENSLARVHVLVKPKSDEVTTKPNIGKIEEQLRQITNSWVEGLQQKLCEKLGERAGEKFYANYVNAFPESFKDVYHFGGTVRDIIKMENAYNTDDMTLDLDLYKLLRDDEETYQLKLFRPGKQVTLSNILPILENMGFHAVDELTFFINPAHKDDGVWVHHFRMRSGRQEFADYSLAEMPPLPSIKDEFEEALYHIWSRNIESDALNKLILRANVKWRDIVMLRAYGKYIMQTAFAFSYDYIASAIARHPVIAALLVKLFHVRFAGSAAKANLQKETDRLKADINKRLAKVINVAEDRVIRQFLDTILATIRTNYFQKDKSGKYKDYISFKFDAKKVPNLPKPYPDAEIFVYSYDVEGVHLRGGKVARGGLRWSDRREDFRTEILGLVKAQQVKNAVIVPVGSKGGFVVKHPLSGGRDEFMAQGIECYKTYLRGLLDITDNIIAGKIIPPKGVVRHDGDDPYLVVAADKGTATFSDIANSVAAEYNFWLSDAFASGGSAGYDHKKMAITARGAWVAVARHFSEKGVDIQKEDFTVVGIGDMSGDVFGNGMLLSKHIKLVGAFNHMHIFIDPNPKPAQSWKERERLFKKPRSGWADYNGKLISKGGGVWSRQEKSIKLSKEMKALLGCSDNSLTPDNLIKRLLRAEVGLIWNGGIGTYIKAEDESHESVGDKANNSLRINAKSVRAKVIGEGGNLGLTQRARIEYSMNGGAVNSDAIDNSGGVDCSDHEVNIKIALRKAVERGKITMKERDRLLVSMTDEVAELVLRDNRLQTQALSIGCHQSPMFVEQKVRLMHALENIGLLDRKMEFLPDDETLLARQAVNKGLVQPELALIIAYSKIHVYDNLIDSNLADDDYFNNDLLSYFPTPMREKFKEEILSHELKREIIATSVANSIINRVGTTFFHRMMDETGMKGCDIARAYISTRDSFNLRELWADIGEASAKIPSEVQTELYLDISRLIHRAVSWFLRNIPAPLKVADTVGKFASGVHELSKSMNRIISPILREVRDEKLNHYIKLGVPAALAGRVADLEALSSACDIIHVTHNQKNGSKLPIATVGEVYFSIGQRLNLGWLRLVARKLPYDSHWENLAIQTITETIYDRQMLLAANVVKSACKGDSCNGATENWVRVNDKNVIRYDAFLSELKQHDFVDQSMLTVAIQRVSALLQG